jgi:hypothetical protein
LIPSLVIDRNLQADFEAQAVSAPHNFTARP